MTHLVQMLRIFFRFILPVFLVLFYILKTYFYPELIWIQYLYILALASMVGYFTNFIAIKMLFHPRKRTAFGRQGLIPRNQTRIAGVLGDNISDQFFLPQDVSKYLLDHKIIHQLIEKGRMLIREKLADPEIQEQIRNWLLKRFRKNQEALHSILQMLSRRNAADLIKNGNAVTGFAHFLSGTIETGIKDGTIDIEQVSKWLGKLLHDHTPQIAQLIYEQFEEYMEGQAGLKKGALKLVKWISSFDRETLQDMLYQKFSSPGFRKDLYAIVESWMIRLTAYLKTDEGMDTINSKYQCIMYYLSRLFEEKGISILLKTIEKALSQTKNWKVIEKSLFAFLRFLDKESRYFLNSRIFKKLLNEGTGYLLAQMNISNMVRDRIQHFDTDQLESLILKTSEEQLGMIEVLGGFLGAFTGIALFNPALFIFLFSGLMLILCLEWIVSKIQKAGSDRSPE